MAVVIVVLELIETDGEELGMIRHASAGCARWSADMLEVVRCSLRILSCCVLTLALGAMAKLKLG